MGHIQRHHLDQAQVIIPDRQQLEEMNMIFEPILEKIMLVNSQIQSLSKTRDELLPRLMSGKVRI
jgi:type I restriction enzyme S subunit